MKQKENPEKVENDLRGIIVRTHRHCQTYRVRIRMKSGQCFDRSFRSKTLAKKWKRDMESAIEQDRYEFTNPATKHTLANLIDLYIERVLPGKPRNAKNVLQHLTWWREELGYLLLAQVRPSLIAEKRDELLAGFVRGGRLRSPTTVVRYLSSLSHVFTKAVKEWEWMRENPVFKIEKPKQAQGRKRVLTDEEQKRLLQACQESGSKDLFLIVALALGTGMRKGEIMGLRWRNIQLRESTGTIVLERTKNGRSRSVLVTGLLLALLQQRHKQQRSDSLVFPSPNHPYQSIDIRSAWERALQKAGIEGFVFHGLRHQAASQAATIENSPLVIGELLGHQTLQMTKHYVHLPSAHMQQWSRHFNQKSFKAIRRVAMHNLENKSQTGLWRPELLTDDEMHECLKETCWTARRASYYVLGLKIPDLGSLEEEKRLCPDFEKYYELFENCFREGRIAVSSFSSEYGKNVQAALPVDWLKLVHKGRLKDDAIEDKEVKREGLYVAPLLTEAWLLLQGKAVFAKRRPAQERDDKLFAWGAARKLRKDFPQLSNRQMAQIIHKHCSKVQKYPFKTLYGWVIDSAIPINEEPSQTRRDRNGRPKKDSYQKLSCDFSSYFNNL